MSKWIRKGDRVVVIAGNDKGKTGEVLSRSEERVLVQGVNIRKKHTKRRQNIPGGGIIDIEVPIHISNVAICDRDGTPLKLKVKQENAKERTLVYQSGKEAVEYRSIRKK
jgi:large subunit ribosomal protein L24